MSAICGSDYFALNVKMMDEFPTSLPIAWGYRKRKDRSRIIKKRRVCSLKSNVFATLVYG